MQRVFALPTKVSGEGRVKFAWQRRVGNYLATSGVNHVVNIFDRKGQHISEIPLPGGLVVSFK